MRIYPAIDLLNGECVRLKKGRFDDKKVYSRDPLEVLKSFEKSGLEYVHIVDLDGAKSGEFKQYATIERLLAQTKLKVQVGGGIRSKETIDRLLGVGAERIILGSLAASDPNSTADLVEKYHAKIVLALDIFFENGLPQVAISGWQQNSQQTLWKLLDFYQQFDSLHFLCTDIHRDGLLQGPNFNLYETCYQHYPLQKFIVSGGVRNLPDIFLCRSLPNVEAVIVGTALYENKILPRELALC